ncbi:MAG: outer membrane domain protein [Caudoviricetes sp.]|nr:MAG: outer membrane domain protein [Caudoviricetes sp.]
MFKGTKGDYYTTYTRGVGTRVCVNNNGNIKTICTLNQNNHEDACNALLIKKSHEMLDMLNKCLVMTKALNCHIISSEIEELIKSATEI